MNAVIDIKPAAAAGACSDDGVLRERGTYDVDGGAPRFAVWLGGKLAGAAGLRLNWLRGPYVQFLGVLPDASLARAGRNPRVVSA